MPFWRREDDEPAHERLAREAGIDLDAPGEGLGEQVEPHDHNPFLEAFNEVGIHGLHRHRKWDAVATVETSELALDEIEFVALPDGTLLVDDAVPDGALTPLAEALEEDVPPPYEARAIRLKGDVWTVAATRIDVLEVPEEVEGDIVDLTIQGDQRTLVIDDRPAWGDVPTLEDHGLGRYDEFVLHAERLDGDLWSVKVNAL